LRRASHDFRSIKVRYKGTENKQRTRQDRRHINKLKNTEHYAVKINETEDNKIIRMQ